MLAVSHLTKTFNLQTQFKDITFTINPTERIGLVGPNGCGKTTLLRILMGLEQADRGEVHCANDMRLGYLPQSPDFPLDSTIDRILREKVGDPDLLSTQLVEIAQRLSDDLEDQDLIAAYDDILQRMQQAEPQRVDQLLVDLGLQDAPRHIPVGRLSGGQKTRLSLALVLLQEPHLLLLDEPTNHLDIEMLEWLENWLAASSCGALIVSHDRTFLDRTVTQILEIYPLTLSLQHYAGNYSAYVEQRAARIAAQWNAYNDQVEEIKRMQADIVRAKAQAAYTEKQASSIRVGGELMKLKGYKSYQQGIARRVAKKAKSREKRLERYLDSDERVERPKEKKQVRIAFTNTTHLGRSVIQMEDLSIGYIQEEHLLQSINLQVLSGQRIAFTGPNGCGKTTLLRTLAGHLPPLQGKVLLGSSVRIGFMSQDLQTLDNAQSAVDHVQPYFKNQTEARRFLAEYLLIGDEVLKAVTFLSLGQQARLRLALLVVQGCNTLLLDEPINHLDIPSRTQFEDALSKFAGAILMVAHDRYLIERFAQHIWKVENGRISAR